MGLTSKDYSWSWVTASRVLSHGPCELVYAYLVPSGEETATILYSGTNTYGDEIVVLESATVTGLPFEPPVPVYCEKGLYITIANSTTGVFVMWHDL